MHLIDLMVRQKRTSQVRGEVIHLISPFACEELSYIYKTKHDETMQGEPTYKARGQRRAEMSRVTLWRPLPTTDTSGSHQ